jgi:hypothetical protein
VELLDGPDSGTQVVGDAEGRFTITGRVASGSVTVRAGKEGYQPVTAPIYWTSAVHMLPGETPRAYVILRLPSSEAYDALGAGEYSLTLRLGLSTARSRPGHPTCSGLPADLTSRTYEATIAEEPVGKRTVTVTGPAIRSSWGGTSMAFLMFVEGNRAVLSFDEDSIGEDLAGFRYLTTYAWTPTGSTAPLTIGKATSIPVSAEFRYCQFKSGRGLYNDCSQAPAEELVAYHSCVSDEATLTFEPR